MSLILELPPELEEELIEEAKHRNLQLSDYILQLLSTEESRPKMPTNGAELVAYWQREGLIGSRPDIKDSQEYARALRTSAENRTQGE